MIQRSNHLRLVKLDCVAIPLSFLRIWYQTSNCVAHEIIAQAPSVTLHGNERMHDPV